MNRVKTVGVTVVMIVLLANSSRAHAIGGGAPRPNPTRTALLFSDYLSIALSMFGL